MELKNYQEDVVLRAIEIALEDQPELRVDEPFVKDVAAYVLNRVPPRYVMSERGFLRLALEHMEDDQEHESLANVIELMMLVNRGVELVRERRRESEQVQREPGVGGNEAFDRDRGFSAAPGLEYLHNYPQFIGLVLDAVTGNPVYGATVSLYLDGDLVPPAARGWSNPYVTREQTRGHFSFWPRPARSAAATTTARLLFTVRHDEYSPFRHEHQVRTEGAFDAVSIIRGDQIVSLPAFRLTPVAQASHDVAGAGSEP